MEWIILIGIIIFFVIYIGSPNTDSSGGASNYSPSIEAIKIRAHQDPVQEGGHSVNCLHVSIKGIFPEFIASPEFRFRLVDSTSGSAACGKPLHSSVSELQSNSSKNFEVRIPFGDSFLPGSGTKDWLRILRIPTDVLVFPEEGTRTVKVFLELADQVTDRIVVRAETSFVKVATTGYLTEEGNETKAHMAVISLGMCLAAQDGKVDNVEVDVIRKWGEKSVSGLTGTSKTNRREQLNFALRDVTVKLKSGQSAAAFDESTAALNRLGEMRYKMEAYELCLGVLRADGKAHPAEMLQLSKMAKILGLNEEKVRMLTDRYTADVEFVGATGGGGDDDAHLGILPDMSKEEIRKHLNKLFRKYSSRAAHDDPEVASKAKAWLEKIGDARARHLAS